MPKKKPNVLLSTKANGLSIRVLAPDEGRIVIEINGPTATRAAPPAPDMEWQDDGMQEDVVHDEAENPDEVGDENDEGPRESEIDVVPL